MAYCALETRPKGMKPWKPNVSIALVIYCYWIANTLQAKQELEIAPGELFCRFGIEEDGVIELCDTVVSTRSIITY